MQHAATGDRQKGQRRTRAKQVLLVFPIGDHALATHGFVNASGGVGRYTGEIVSVSVLCYYGIPMPGTGKGAKIFENEGAGTDNRRHADQRQIKNTSTSVVGTERGKEHFWQLLLLLLLC